MAPLRLVFMGTPGFAVPALEALIAAGHDVAAAYCRPARPAGRGRKPRPSPVQACAEAHGIEVRTPATLRAPEAQAAFRALGPDAAVVAAYGLILPKPVLDAPRLGCLNIHASLLPRWRGAAPIQRAIMAGDAETGITVMAMDEGLDTGPMLLSEATPIGPETTAGELHDRLAAIGARLIVRALAGLTAGGLTPVPQPANGVTHAPKLTPEDERLDWRRPAAELERRIRALAPRPGAAFAHAGEAIKVTAARVAEGAGAPGTVLDDRATVACGAAALRLLRLQRPGRAALEADAFLRGYALPPGTRLPLPDDEA